MWRKATLQQLYQIARFERCKKSFKKSALKELERRENMLEAIQYDIFDYIPKQDLEEIRYTFVRKKQNEKSCNCGSTKTVYEVWVNDLHLDDMCRKCIMKTGSVFRGDFEEGCEGMEREEMIYLIAFSTRYSESYLQTRTNKQLEQMYEEHVNSKNGK